MNYEELCHMNIGDMNKEQLYEFVNGLLEEVWNFEKEIERLNNIINEFDKFLFGELQSYGGGGSVQEYYDKLKELKGGDK